MSKKFGAGVFALLLALFCAGAPRAQEPFANECDPHAINVGAGLVPARSVTKTSGQGQALPLQKLPGYTQLQSAKEAAKTGSPTAKQIAPAAGAPATEQDDADREDPCPGSNSQHELNRCAARARDRADAELNKVYRELMKDTSGAERVKLRDAQLAWIKFRDAHCDYRSVGNTGGSIYPMVYSFCLAGVTNERVKQLREIISENRQQ